MAMMANRGTRIRWLDVAAAVVIIGGAVAVLLASSRMGWASRVDDLGTATFTDGPRSLLASAAIASTVLSLVVVPARWRWIRWVLLGTAVMTALAAVAVYLSSIYNANTTHSRQALGPTETSFAEGAVVGVLAAWVVVVVALVGLLTSSDARPRTPPTLPLDRAGGRLPLESAVKAVRADRDAR